MKRIVFLVFAVIVSLVVLSCSSKDDKPLKISATTWIGYTPLFYAKEKGWLDKSNIKLLHVVSLSENMYLYKAGNADAYVGTQYEHSVLKDTMPSLVPIMMFDRSNGGDIIMSNVSLKSLVEGKNTIDAYLEMDSINYTMLNDFVSKYNIDDKRINYINRDQTEIASLQASDAKNATIIVTYIPYDTELKKSGFKEILSTKNGMDILVVDAMFTRFETLLKHKVQFEQLKGHVDNALTALEKDPKAFYELIKHYLDGLSYEAFSSGLNDIEWINRELSVELRERLRESAFPLKDLI